MTDCAITLTSSHGNFFFNLSGKLIDKQLYASAALEFPECDQPHRLDLSEHNQTYPDYPLRDSVWDILDWGYWTKEGVYEEPCWEWRAERNERIAEPLC